MLNDHERHMLDEVERQLRSDDPAFVSRLGDRQQQLPGTRGRTRGCAGHFRFRWPVVGLLVLVVGLLMLGLGGPALLVAALAAALGWLSAVHVEAHIDAKESRQ